MNLPSPWLVLLAILLIFLAGCFAASETALSRVSRGRAVKVCPGGSTGPLSTGRPSSTHRFQPPSSTLTRSCP